MNRLLRTLHLQGERHYGKKVAEAQTTEDLWRLLEERVPPIVREYFRGAADEEITLRGNVQAFRQTMTTAWGALKLDQLDLRTTVVGHELGVPFFVAPVGSLGALWPDAEAIAAKVAGEFRTVMALSTLTLTPMEKVRAASTGHCYFQLYLCGGREVATRGIERAKKAGFSALILTIDSGVAGNRVVHARMKPMAALQSFSGLSARERSRLFREKLSVLPQMLEHHRWLTSYWVGGGKMEFVNIQLDQNGTPMPYADIGTQLAASAVTWKDIGWIKDAWGDRPLIVKGVHNADDAKRAEDCGASAVIWSNHGGRQLDGVLPALHIVEQEMPRMEGSKMDFMMDGGVRTGRDVLIALTYGIKAVGLGRVCAAGLGAGGYAGMRRAFEIVCAELTRSMQLLGISSVRELRKRGAEIRRTNMLVGDAYLPKFVF